MKCIKFVSGSKSGQVENVNNEQAFALVEKNLAVFVQRSEWKEKTRPFIEKVSSEVAQTIKENKKNENKIGRSIATARKAKSLTQEELAVKLGIEKKVVSSWEKGSDFADEEMIAKIEKVLDRKIRV